jgi:hypothetical protein
MVSFVHRQTASPRLSTDCTSAHKDIRRVQLLVNRGMDSCGLVLSHMYPPAAQFSLCKVPLTLPPFISIAN